MRPIVLSCCPAVCPESLGIFGLVGLVLISSGSVGLVLISYNRLVVVVVVVFFFFFFFSIDTGC